MLTLKLHGLPGLLGSVGLRYMNRCYTESDVIAELRGWNAMSGDNDVVCVLWICVVVGTESYVCDQLPKLPEEPPPIGDCAGVGRLPRQPQQQASQDAPTHLPRRLRIAVGCYLLRPSRRSTRRWGAP